MFGKHEGSEPFTTENFYDINITKVEFNGEKWLRKFLVIC